MGRAEQWGGVIETGQWDGPSWQVGVGTGQMGGVSNSTQFDQMGGVERRNGTGAGAGLFAVPPSWARMDWGLGRLVESVARYGLMGRQF